ncbi:HAD-IA family hydrolase [bacterium]|nr:HAD-IA family hydrolase [bacterium]
MTNTHTDRITTILFDAGNTLAFVDLDRVGRIFGEAGFPQPREALARAEHAGRAVMYRASERDPAIRDRDRWDVYMRSMFDSIGLRDEAVATRIHDELLEVHRRENLWRAVPKDTLPALDELRTRGYRLGVISNADGRVPTLLAELGLADRFEVIIDSHLVGVEKPDPRIFALALERMGAGPAEAMYVGDFPAVDVAGARGAGLAPVLLDPLGAASDPGCPVIAALSELPLLLPARAPAR